MHINLPSLPFITLGLGHSDDLGYLRDLRDLCVLRDLAWFMCGVWLEQYAWRGEGLNMQVLVHHVSFAECVCVCESPFCALFFLEKQAADALFWGLKLEPQVTKKTVCFHRTAASTEEDSNAKGKWIVRQATNKLETRKKAVRVSCIAKKRKEHRKNEHMHSPHTKEFSPTEIVNIHMWTPFPADSTRVIDVI